MKKNRQFNFSFNKKLDEKHQLAICMNLRKSFSDTLTLALSQVLNVIVNSDYEQVRISQSAIASRLGIDKSTVHRALNKAVDLGLLAINNDMKFPRYNFGTGKDFSSVILNYYVQKNKVGSKPKDVHIERVDVRKLPVGDQQDLGDYLKILSFNHRSYNQAVNKNNNLDVIVHSQIKAAELLGCCRQSIKSFIARMTKGGYLTVFREKAKLVFGAGIETKTYLLNKAESIRKSLVKKRLPEKRPIPF